jgi:ribosomal protein S18 acetylase RimI-like enzyme
MSEPIEMIYRIQKQDIQKSGAILTDAFQKDPVWNAVFGADTTIAQRNSVFAIPVRYCLKFGEVYATSKDLEGIIAWTPGRLAEMTIGRLIQCGGFFSGLKIGAKLPRRMDSIFRVLMEDQKENMRGVSYLYLHILGVNSKYQGRGFGGRLLRTMIEICGRLGTPIYLETETESNVRMYEKFGFRVLKKRMLPVIDLPMWEMVRQPS